MKIYLHEITDLETELEFDQSEKWLADAVENVDEEGTGPKIAPVSPRPIHASFSLRKVDEVVVATGLIESHIRMLCSRCANVFNLPTHQRFSALYCKDPVMAGVGHLEGNKPAGQNKGFARHAHDEGRDEAVAEGSDLDITYLSADYVDLAEIVTEQLRLQIPFQPLCTENCKGICFNCGADQNLGRCACSKLAASTPFSVLEKIKGLKL